MRYYRYIEPQDPENENFTTVTVTLSEQKILDYYWDYWYSAMCKKYGKENVDKDYDQDRCIQDWMTVHWAWEVEDHQGERRDE
jgi:hypothetical protein